MPGPAKTVSSVPFTALLLSGFAFVWYMAAFPYLLFWLGWLRYPILVCAVLLVGVSLFAWWRCRTSRSIGIAANAAFKAVAWLEGIAIVAAILTLRQLNHTSFIMATIALIVGAHFLALAYVYRIRHFALIGIVVMLIAATAAAALPVEPRNALIGLGTAAVLWIQTLLLLVRLLHSRTERDDRRATKWR